MWDKLFGTVNGLEKGLGASWLRNEVITNNIANVDTPGYKASDIVFEDILSAAAGMEDGLEMKTTRAGHMGPGNAERFAEINPVLTTSEDASYRLDENNVDIESEMVSLAQNSLQYYAMVGKLNGEFQKLGMAISGQV